jgi:clan AA aspartic protease (TIGR02281 family)
MLSERQNFYHVVFDTETDAPGVLLQNRKIVGWTFGAAATGAYLWKGPAESDLVVELSVADFYRLTFQNSREEQFIVAYSMEDMPLGDQLAAFARGFRREPVLFSDNTPARLTTKAVVDKMRALISAMVGAGNFYHILPLLDSRVLAESGDVLFLTDVLTFGVQVSGPEAVIEIINSVLLNPGSFDETAQGRIREFQKTMYEKWLNQMMNTGDYDGGLAAYRQAAKAFRDDPDIRLAGVRLALVFNDWKTAENILASGRFPVALTDRIRALENRITELKFQDDKIVIQFPPGSGKVSSSAVVNNRIEMEFLVDTGASMVTIPGAAARKLGIDINPSTPMERLVTAGGVIRAPRITLDAVTIDGWTERNIPAYVVDIPEQPGIGLLGLNFLNRFRMDLNTKAGVLTLAPR